MPLVMVVDDDQDLAEMLSIVLTGAGMEVDLVNRGDQVMDLFNTNTPDLILLDVMLPGIDGIEVCKLIREKSMVPIVMLTAKGDTHDVVLGLEAGADDYMVKPFKPQELVARINTRLRRVAKVGTLGICDLVIDQMEHKVIKNGKEIALTRLEFDLLAALAKEPGRVFTREALLSEVWGYQHAADTRLVNVHVQRLRSKIESDADNPEYVLTVRGVGYKAGAGNRFPIASISAAARSPRVCRITPPWPVPGPPYTRLRLYAREPLMLRPFRHILRNRSDDWGLRSIFKPSGITLRLGKCDRTKFWCAPSERM